MKIKAGRFASVASLLASLASCAHGGGPSAPAGNIAPAVIRGPFALQVREGRRGVPGAQVTVRAASSPDAFAEGVLWQGVTDASGQVRGIVPLRADQRRVSVTVQRTGYDGPYTDDDLRAAFGFFAPSAWIEVEVGALASLGILLARRPR